jgi:hypothetical protein
VTEAPCSPRCTHLRTTAASTAARPELAALARGVVKLDAAALGAVGGEGDAAAIAHWGVS